jgi:multidrug efflux pump subunit AcrA (membrane-fusion protein)
VAAGLVEPIGEQLKIGSELDGRLRQVLVDEGSPVSRGGIIAVLENGDYQARVELAKANLAEREAALERLRNGSRQEERREALANVREVEAMLDIARNERGRRAQLLDRGAISRTEFDIADREFRIAQARLEAARERFAFVDADARRDEVMRAEAEVARAKAQIAEAEAMLAKTLIRSRWATPRNCAFASTSTKPTCRASPSASLLTSEPMPMAKSASPARWCRSGRRSAARTFVPTSRPNALTPRSSRR